MARDFQALLESDRVGLTTRETLSARVAVISGTAPRLLNAEDFGTLDAATRRLVPQPAGDEFVDIAGGIDRALRDGVGDGWRYDELPPDREAFEFGLRAIESLAQRRHGCAFCTLGPLTQDELLGVVAADSNTKRWFEDLLAAAAEIYVSHPTTLTRIGFSGIAFRPRWNAIGLGAKRAWEPVASP